MTVELFLEALRVVNLLHQGLKTELVIITPTPEGLAIQCRPRAVSDGTVSHVTLHIKPITREQAPGPMAGYNDHPFAPDTPRDEPKPHTGIVCVTLASNGKTKDPFQHSRCFHLTQTNIVGWLSMPHHVLNNPRQGSLGDDGPLLQEILADQILGHGLFNKPNSDVFLSIPLGTPSTKKDDRLRNPMPYQRIKVFRDKRTQEWAYCVVAHNGRDLGPVIRDFYSPLDAKVDAALGITSLKHGNLWPANTPTSQASKVLLGISILNPSLGGLYIHFHMKDGSTIKATRTPDAIQQILDRVLTSSHPAS